MRLLTPLPCTGSRPRWFGQLPHFRGLIPIFLLTLFAGGCASSISVMQRREAAQPAIALLQAGRFDEAARAADQVLHADAKNPQAHLVAALTSYKAAAHQFSSDIRTIPLQVLSRSFNHQYLRFTLEKTATALSGVEAHLAVAAAAPWVDLELCLACWQVDWNHNGRVDDGDQRLLEIEVDESGEELPDGDPRRRPTFRFDLGDVYWARAMIAFQRAVLEILQAWHWEEVDKIFARIEHEEDATITLRLGSKRRITGARELILDGLAHSDRARREYLAENDDDREWVPSPRQKNHPMPLPVDDALYRTWEELTGDLRRLVSGEEGLDVAELAQLGGHRWENPPRGFIDVGRLLSDPSDIVIPLKHASKAVQEASEEALRSLFGRTYVPTMRPTPMLRRLARMKAEVDRGHESLRRKLRYLFWLN